MPACIIAHWSLPEALTGALAQKKMWVRWSHTMKAFGASTICLIGSEIPSFGDEEMELLTASSLHAALDHARFSGMNKVFVELGGSPMASFVHPESAVYVFGSDYSSGLPQADIEIDTVGPLHAEVACGVVLSHRRAQWP